MSSENLKLFAKFAGNREQFENTEYPATYENSIVFIDANGDETKNCIYTHGEYYGTSTALDDLIDKMSNPIPVTHEELVNLRDNGQLVGGVRYVITDYVTDGPDATNIDGHQMQYASNSIPFNIIVTATSSNSLSEECSAVSNTDYPNADKWKLYYTINSTDDRFGWTNSTGIIYRMIDENNNDCPYDFKNIQFFIQKWEKCTLSEGDPYFNILYKFVHPHSGGIGFQTKNGYRFYDYEETFLKSVGTGESYYYFTFEEECRNVTIKPTYNKDYKQIVSPNIFLGYNENVYLDSNCYDNIFSDCHNVYISQDCCKNYLYLCSDVKFDISCKGNFLSSAFNIYLQEDCKYNYIITSDYVKLLGSNKNCCISDCRVINIGFDSCRNTLTNCHDICDYRSSGILDSEHGETSVGGSVTVDGSVNLRGNATVNDKTVLVETIPVMYWELMDMCANGTLVPGQTYKILDYECNDSYYYFTYDLYIKYRSRHNIYSIIVTAVSTSTLSHEATLVIDNAYASYVEGVSGIGEFDDVEVVDDGVAEVSDETKTLYAYDTYKVKYITHSDQRYKDSAFTVLNNDDIYIPTADGYKNDQYFLFEGKEEYNYSGAVFIRQEQNSSFEYIKTLYYCTGVNAGFDYSTTYIDGTVHTADVYIFRELNGTRELGVTIKSIDRDSKCKVCPVSYNSNTGKYARTGEFSSCPRPYTDGLPYMKKYNSSSYESALSYFPEIETKRQHGVIYELKDSFGNSFPYDVLSISQIDYKHNESESVPHIGGKLPIKVSDYMVNTTVGPYVARYNDGTDTKYYNLPVATIITDDMDERYCNIMVINSSHFDLVSNSMYVNNVKRY